MAILISDYLQIMQVSGIVRLSSNWREEQSGYQTEHTVEEIICLVDGQPHQMKVHWTRRFFPSARLRYLVEEDTPITDGEYKKIVDESGGILDTPDVIAQISRRTEILQQIKELKPDCPKCKKPMEQRTGRYGDFWGCSRYPKCDGTRKWDENLATTLNELWKEMEQYRNI